MTGTTTEDTMTDDKSSLATLRAEQPNDKIEAR